MAIYDFCVLWLSDGCDGRRWLERRQCSQRRVGSAECVLAWTHAVSCRMSTYEGYPSKLSLQLFTVLVLCCIMYLFSVMLQGAHMHGQSQTCQQDGRSTPYPVYEDAPYNGDNGARQRNTPEFAPSVAPSESTRVARERFPAEPRRSPPEEKRPPPPPVVPLPAFQQAFGSTEIGKFAEAFSRTEVAVDDAPADSFIYESYPEWDGSIEPQWSSQPASREIKCEDNF